VHRLSSHASSFRRSGTRHRAAPQPTDEQEGTGSTAGGARTARPRSALPYPSCARIAPPGCSFV
jgi:hypothetical protein